jgi:hypothetical protein
MGRDQPRGVRCTTAPVGRDRHSAQIQMLGGLTLGPAKLEHIFAQTGRMPVLACGNADVDIEMLTAESFALLVNHDDGGREYARGSWAGPWSA